MMQLRYKKIAQEFGFDQRLKSFMRGTKMKTTMLKLLGTAALASFAFSASAQTTVNISGLADVLEDADIQFANQGDAFDFDEFQDFDDFLDDQEQNGDFNTVIVGNVLGGVSLPANPDIALATALAAVDQIGDAAVQINSISTNVAAVDSSINLSVEGPNGSEAASNAASQAAAASNTAGNVAFDFAIATDDSTTSESIDLGNVIENTTTDTFAANGAFAGATSSANSASDSASNAASNSVDGSVFVFGDIGTVGLGANNTTDVAFLSGLTDTISTAANTSNTAAAFDSFNAGGLGVNALATNTATINASLTGSFSGGSATVGNLSTVGAGAINTARISGAAQITVE
jgi:hypothetical protein